MDKEKIMDWFTIVWCSVIGLCVSLFLLKLTYDFLTAPNIFIKEPVALNQKQTDDMCVKWWFDSDLTAAKKRVCGK
jgi:hypothetical protein